MSDWWLLLGAVVALLLAAVLSATEAALADFSRARAEECVDEELPGAKRLLQVASDHAPYVAALVLLRITADMTAIVLAALWALDRWSGALGVSAVIAVLVVVWFVLVDVSPRTLGRQHDQRLGLAMAGPVVWLTRLLGPLPRVLILLSNAVTPGRGFAEGPFSSELELREAVDLAEASDLIDDDERKMLHSVFEFGDTVAREVMVPRPDVVFIERHKNLRQTMSLFLRSGYSRLPVVDDDLDDVVGIAFFKDVARRDFENPDVELTMRIDEVMRPAAFVPETKPVDELLTQMQASRQHMVMLVDEYGGTAGLVTIEDIVEEIVGEIADEYDAPDSESEPLSDGVWRVSSRFAIDDLEELIGREVEDNEVDSVLGLLAKELGRVPLPGAVVETQGVRFEAERAAGRRNQVHTVLVSVVAEDDDDAAEA